jgi:hypothetical protein
MKRSISKSIIVAVVFCLVVLLLPQFVKATTQVGVTEIADFKPAEQNNNATVNLANTSIIYNWDTWDPLPSGVFVGGNIQESSIQLQDYAAGIQQATGYADQHISELLLAQPLMFSQAQLSSGASQMTIRLPMACSADSQPTYVRFVLYLMASATDYQVVRRDMAFSSSSDYMMDVAPGSGVGYLKAAGWTQQVGPYGTSPTLPFYERGGRIYTSMALPVHTEQWYLAVAYAYYPMDSRWNLFLSPADLASDNNSASTIAWEYHPAYDMNITRTVPIPTDLGFSFVFETSLGIDAVSYERYFIGGDYIRMNYLLPCPTGRWWYNGSLNFVQEFRLNVTQHLTWGLQITSRINVGGINYTYDVINRAYWTGQVNDQMILASNPVNFNYTTTMVIDGVYYISFLIDLYIQNSPGQRVTFLMYDQGASTLYNGPASYQRTQHYSTSGVLQQLLFFQIWNTLSLDSYSLNQTGTHAPPKSLATHHHGPIRLDWCDGIAVLFIVGGIIAAPFTLGGSLVLIGIGIGMILYQNWPALRGAVDGLIKGVLDGLSWLGNWIWKLGEYIWKALTWFVDQIVYYGSILIGLLIIAVAFGLFIVPIYALIKIMGAFLLMAQGEYEKAAAQISGLVAQGRSAAGTVTGGRVG